MSAQDLPLLGKSPFKAFSSSTKKSYCKCERPPPLKHNKSFSQYFLFQGSLAEQKRNSLLISTKNLRFSVCCTVHITVQLKRFLYSLNPLRVKLRPNSSHWNPILRRLRLFWIYCYILSQQNQLAWNFHCAALHRDWLMGRGTLAVRFPQISLIREYLGGKWWQQYFIGRQKKGLI